MAYRLYFVTVQGLGTLATPFTPVASLGISVDVCDGRSDPTLASGEFALVLDTTTAQHTTMLATVGVTYAPFEDALGNAKLPADSLASVGAANRTTLTMLYETRHIPIDDLVGSDPVKKAWRRAVVRMLLRQILGPDDLTEGLDTLVSSMTAARRQTLATKLQAAGYDTAGMGSGTVRQAIRLLASQFVRLSRTAED